MRKLKCGFVGEVNNHECHECFRMLANDEYATSIGMPQELVGALSTRAECVAANAEYITESFLPIKDDSEIDSFEEFVNGMVDVNDEDACFELSEVIWIGVTVMVQKEYVTAEKEFIHNLEKHDFEKIDAGQIAELGLEGVWYKRMKRMV